MSAFLDKVNFSIDQPFGIKLDTYFAQAYELATGNPIDSFVFQEGVTPLSTQAEVAMWTITYLIVIFGGRQVMKNQDAFKLKPLFILHNFLLTIASGALLVLFIENLVPILARHGLFYAICNEGAWTQRLELLYYLNYLVKYWELADTVFLVLKKKPLGRSLCSMGRFGCFFCDKRGVVPDTFGWGSKKTKASVGCLSLSLFGMDRFDPFFLALLLGPHTHQNFVDRDRGVVVEKEAYERPMR